MGRLVWLVGLFVLSSCSKHNPASCCTTDQQCIDLGLSQIYPCAGDQVCNAGTCVAPECETATDCPGTTRFCIDHLCSAACTTNDDCAGDGAHPLCEPDGTCGACVDSSTCSANTPVCDSHSHECVGCQTGTDCPSHVCDTSSGACVDPATLAYIADSGTDAGTCSVGSPCRTIDYASAMLGSRTTIFIVGATYTAQATVQLTTHPFTLTSDHAVIMGGDPIFALPTGSTNTWTFRSLTLGAAGNVAKSLTIGGTTLTLEDVSIQEPFQVDTVGSLAIVNSTVNAPGASSASLSIVRSMLHAGITITGGSLHYDSNRYTSPTGTAITKTNTGGDVKIIDSVFVTNGTTAAIALTDVGQVAFCTFVSTQTTNTAAVSCAGVNIGSMSSSIDAWNTQVGGCSASHTLFAGPASGGSNGNVVGPVANFFVDLGGGDYRPSAINPGLGQGDPTAPGADHDITGAARSSSPDDGAYEAP